MADEQAQRPMVMWRVKLDCWVTTRVAQFPVTEIVDVEAPENDIVAAGSAAIRELHAQRQSGRRCSVVRVYVERLENRTPPSTLAQQSGLWDAPVDSEATR